MMKSLTYVTESMGQEEKEDKATRENTEAKGGREEKIFC